MTIDEAIAHERELEKSYMDMAKRCLLDNRFQKQDECVMFSEEHKQLAEWLEELKVYRDNERIYDRQYDIEYDKAIDDFISKAFEMIKAEQDTRYGYLDGMDIREIAEQLKAGGTSGIVNK